MDLRETVRTWLVDAKFDVIDQAELVELADKAIAQLDSPPDYLFAVSLGEPLIHLERLDLVKYPPTNADLARLAERLLMRLKSSSIDLQEIVRIATNIDFASIADGHFAWSQFSWITDENHLIEEGIKPVDDFEKGVIEALREAASSAPE
jgi:hypothetical protein